MNLLPGRSKRRTRAWGLLGGLSWLNFLASCILTSPAELPTLPLYPPTFIRSQAVPSSERPLAVFPQRFVVPVRLLDPTARFQWRLFYDFESGRLGPGLQALGVIEPDGTNRNVRDLVITVTPPEDVTRCHFIELRVATAFGGTEGNTPEAPGGDSIVWTYSPGGDLRGCPTLDVGAGAGAPEAGTNDGGRR
jgi:hypothetical protein